MNLMAKKDKQRPEQANKHAALLHCMNILLAYYYLFKITIFISSDLANFGKPQAMFFQYYNTLLVQPSSGLYEVACNTHISHAHTHTQTVCTNTPLATGNSRLVMYLIIGAAETHI